MTTRTVQRFLLPDVGEGLTEAEIVAWHVAVGEIVTVNQIIVDIETAKSVVELPSPFAGEVIELLAPEGETVEVGTAIIAIGTDAESTSGLQAPAPPPDTAQPERHQRADDQTEPQLLVGYGPRGNVSPRRRRGGAGRDTLPETATSGEEATEPEVAGRARAKPPVRKLASVLGVDLSSVTPSGPEGIIVRADVLDAAQRGGASRENEGRDSVTETRIPIKGVRKHMAAAMTASAFTAPHVTEFISVDVTKTLDLRALVQRRPEFHDVKLSPLAFVARAYLRALARTPLATARWEEAAQEIVVPTGVNLGVAAATPRGLVVPNIASADRLGLRDLAAAINELAVTARAGKTPPEAMVGGNTTITNVGVFGVDTGTPILNPGETAILAVGAIRRQPWVVEDGAGERIEPRSILQLALSFDHRVMDGQQGSEVLANTAAFLAEPGLAVL